jgi:peptide/nickel transport system substrate-binding protein
MRLKRPAFQLAALAAVGATVLAACGTATSSGSAKIAPHGSFGAIPAETGTAHAGTITWAFAPGTAPTWIFPVVPGANSSVYTAYQFQEAS